MTMLMHRKRQLDLLRLKLGVDWVIFSIRLTLFWIGHIKTDCGGSEEKPRNFSLHRRRRKNGQKFKEIETKYIFSPTSAAQIYPLYLGWDKFEKADFPEMPPTFFSVGRGGHAHFLGPKANKKWGYARRRRAIYGKWEYFWKTARKSLDFSRKGLPKFRLILSSTF